MSAYRLKLPLTLTSLRGTAWSLTAPPATAREPAPGAATGKRRRPVANAPLVLGRCRSVEEFEKQGRLGEGTYGVVYRARDTTNGAVVALKKIRMNRHENGLPLSSFREIMLLKQLQHPNVVTLLDVVVGSYLDSVFMVLECCELDLGTLLDHKAQPFRPSEVKCLMHQLLSGVQYCHERHVIHRDLKLSNLLLTAQGTLKIADFGLGRIYATPPERMTPRVVTLWYRAPELLLGDKRYTPAVDMWSVGCIFGELLLHQPCLPGTSELQQLERIVDLLGTPRERIWPGIRRLPLYKQMTLPKQPYNNVRVRFANASPGAHQLLNALFTYDPSERATAGQALAHGYFQEAPPAVDPSLLPVYAKAHCRQSKRAKQM